MASTYTLRASDGALLSVDIHAKAGVHQSGQRMPTPGSPTSTVDNAAEAAPHVGISRSIQATVKLVGTGSVDVSTPVASSSGAVNRRKLLSSSRTAAADLQPQYGGVDHNGKPFRVHGPALLQEHQEQVRRLREDDGSGAAAGASSALKRILKSDSLFVSVTPSLRKQMKAGIQDTAEALESGEHDLSGIAADRVDTSTNSGVETDAETGEERHFVDIETKRIHGRRAALADAHGLSTHDGKDAGFDSWRGPQPGRASSTSMVDPAVAATWAADATADRLLHMLQCLPDHFFDDNMPTELVAKTGHMPCLAHIQNTTKEDQGLPVAMHRLLLANPCLNVHASVGNALAHPGIASAHADHYIALGNDAANQALWNADADGTTCDDAVYTNTRLSNRLVELLVGLIVTHIDPDMVHTEPLLLNMMLRPDLYRYPATLEYALKSLFFYEAPSEVVVEAAWHVSQHIDDRMTEIYLHDSDSKALALLATAAIMRTARLLHTQGHLTIDPFQLTELGMSSSSAASYNARLQSILAGRKIKYNAALWDGRMLSFLYAQQGRVQPVHEARQLHIQLATEAAFSLWPTLEPHRRWHYIGVGQGMTGIQAEKMLAIAPEAGGMTDGERTHAELKGIASFRDLLMRETKARPYEIEDVRHTAVTTIMRRLGPAVTGLANTSRVTEVHQARRLAAESALNYKYSQYAGAARQSDLILRVLGNLAHPDGIALVYNFTGHDNSRLREAALHALSRMGSTAELPGSQRVRRLGIELPSRPLALVQQYTTPSHLASKAPQARTRILNPSEYASGGAFLGDAFDMEAPAHLVAAHPTLFHHMVIGTDAQDVEDVVLQVLLHHHEPLAQVEALQSLAKMRPLRHDTVDAVLDWYESRMAAFDPRTCEDACIVSKPMCRAVPIAGCRAECESVCTMQGKVFLAAAEFLKQRVEAELDDSAATEPDEVFEHDPILQATARRVQEALQSDFNAGLDAIAGDDVAARRRLVDLHASGQLDASQQIVSGKVLPLATESGDGTHARLTRALRALQEASSVSEAPATPLAARRRVLSYRSVDGKPHPRHLARARRLGIFTLLDITLGKGFKYEKLFGSDSMGVRLYFENRNQFKLRITLFDGFFRAEEYNEGFVLAQLFILKLDLIHVKAALIGGFAYMNKIARDMAQTVAKIGDNTYGRLQSVAGPVIAILNRVVSVCLDLSKTLDEGYMAKLKDFIALKGDIEDAITTSYQVSSAWSSLLSTGKSIRDVVPKVRSLNSALNAWSQAAVPVSTDAVSLGWSAMIRSAVDAASAIGDNVWSTQTATSDAIQQAAAVTTLMTKGDYQRAATTVGNMGSSALAALQKLDSAIALVNSNYTEVFLNASVTLPQNSTYFTAKTGLNRTIPMPAYNLTINFNDIQYAFLLNRTASIMLAPASFAISEIAKAMRILNATLSDGNLLTLTDPVMISRLTGSMVARPLTAAPGASGTRMLAFSDEDMKQFHGRGLLDTATTFINVNNAANSVPGSLKTLHTALCAVTPMLDAVVNGNGTMMLTTDIGGVPLKTVVASVRDMKAELQSALDAANAVSAFANTVLNGPNGVNVAINHVIQDTEPKTKVVVDALESLIYQFTAARDAAKAGRDWATSLTNTIQALPDSVSTPLESYASPQQAAFANAMASGGGSFASALGLFANATRLLYSTTLVDARDNIGAPYSTFNTSFYSAFSAVLAWEVANMSASTSYTARYASAVPAIRSFQAAHRAFIDSRNVSRTLDAVVSAVQAAADWADTDSVLTVARRTASMLAGLTDLDDTLNSMVDFNDKLQRMDGRLQFALSQFQNFIPQFQAQSAWLPGFTSTLAAVKRVVQGSGSTSDPGLDPWLQQSGTRIPGFFNASLDVAAAGRGVYQAYLPALNDTTTQLTTVARQLDDAVSFLQYLAVELYQAVTDFHFTIRPVIDAQVFFTEWQSLMTFGDGTRGAADYWRLALNHLNFITDFSAGSKRMLSLLKVLNGANDDAACYKKGSTYDVTYVFRQQNARRLLAHADNQTGHLHDDMFAPGGDQHADVHDEHGLLVFPANDHIGESRVSFLPAAFEEHAAKYEHARHLQSTVAASVTLNNDDVANLRMLGLPDSAVLMQAKTSTTNNSFCFGAAVIDATCRTVATSLRAYLASVQSAYDSQASFAVDVKGVAMALDDATSQMLKLQVAAPLVTVFFNRTARVLADTIRDPYYQVPLSEAAAVSAILMPTLLREAGNIKGKHRSAAVTVNSRVNLLSAEASLFVQRAPSAGALPYVIPGLAKLVENLVVAAPSYTATAALTMKLAVAVTTATRYIMPMTRDKLTESIDAVINSLQSATKAYLASKAAIDEFRSVTEKIDTIVSIITEALDLGIPRASKVEWNKVPWCRSEAMCARVIRRASPAYRKGLFQLRYMQVRIG